MIKKLGSKNQSRERSGGGFKYQKRDADSVKKRANQTGARFDSPFNSKFDTWRAKDGENLIRILPATWEDAEHYGLDLWMHRFIGADNSNYLCLDKMQGKPCPACDEAKAAKAAGEDDDAKQLQPQKRVLVWVLDRDDDSNTPQLWDMSWAQDRDISALCENKRSGNVLLIDHPDKGYDVTVKKTGKGLKTRYQFIIDRDPTPIHDDEKVQEDVLDFITENPLPTVLRYDTAEHIEKQLSGTAPSRDDDLDDDDKPSKRGKGSRRGRDDEDEEDEKPSRSRRRGRDAEEEEEEEDETPARSRRGKREEPEEEEEEDERPARSRRRTPEPEEEEEDEEDEKPARSRRGKREEPEEEEEEEERPSRTRRRAAKDDDDDEEEEERPSRSRRRAEPEEEEEEEEEDEKPARSRRRR